MMKKVFFSVAIAACLLSGSAFASDAQRIVDKGNRLYKNQKYEDALKLYGEALSKHPNSAIINFDTGTAQYKMKDYQKASSSFERSLVTQDKGFEAKANYNLGNSKYMLGLSKENTDLTEAVRLLEQALTNYKRTVESTPKDKDAEVNFKIVSRKLEELKKKIKKETQENKNKQKQQEQNNKQAQSQNQPEDSKQEEKRQDQAEQESKKDADKENQPGREQAQESQQQSEQQKQGGQNIEERETAAQPPNQSGDPGHADMRPEESKEMSEEEVNMLLEGYRQEENNVGMLRDNRKGVQEKVLKDW